MPATPTTVLNIKTPIAVKKEAQKLAEDIGLPLSAVVNVLLRQFVRNGFLHLEGESSVPTPYLAKVLDGAKADIARGKNLIGPFRTQKENKKFLESL